MPFTALTLHFDHILASQTVQTKTKKMVTAEVHLADCLCREKIHRLHRRRAGGMSVYLVLGVLVL